MTLLLVATAAAAAAIAALLVRLLRPAFVRYALARPNARSSHTEPTPQGGGIPVLAATIGASAAALSLSGEPVTSGLALVAGAAVVLAILGGTDDVRPLPVGLRLAVQAMGVFALLGTFGSARLLPVEVPAYLELGLLLLALLWWVNLVNFMDGIDWLTVAEFVPLTAALALSGLVGAVPLPVALTAAALCGGLCGFAPANRPVARLFLGDVGSLPIGLVTGWLLLNLAMFGSLPAALLLPMYYGADATLTLLARLRRGARVWEAHREHAYQRALSNGYRVIDVDRRVFGLNVGLAALAALCLAWPDPAVDAVALGLGAVLTGLTLRAFGQPRGPSSRDREAEPGTHKR